MLIMTETTFAREQIIVQLKCLQDSIKVGNQSFSPMLISLLQKYFENKVGSEVSKMHPKQANPGNNSSGKQMYFSYGGISVKLYC